MVGASVTCTQDSRGAARTNDFPECTGSKPVTLLPESYRLSVQLGLELPLASLGVFSWGPAVLSVYEIKRGLAELRGSLKLLVFSFIPESSRRLEDSRARSRVTL